MSRSPLAYPLTRGIDGDSGGAADLQTDIMRFMAILALCLVAIFALVQSLPMAPQGTNAAVVVEAPRVPIAPDVPVEAPARPQPPTSPPRQAAMRQEPRPVSLTRPKWTPKVTAASRPAPAAVQPATVVEPSTESTPLPPVKPPTPAAPVDHPTPPAAAEEKGFTLRFESDLALTRLVASGQVGFYAIDDGRAQRMSVRDSRISFWAASTPNEVHEMEATTVPQPVVDALRRSGADAAALSFGVTLPSKLRNELAQLMNEHRGGALVIGANGSLKLEAGG